jgi:hypothetical protein
MRKLSRVASAGRPNAGCEEEGGSKPVVPIRRGGAQYRSELRSNEHHPQGTDPVAAED